MPDILLVNSSIKYGEIARGFQYYPPVGLNYLAASLRLAGFTPTILDLGIEPLSTDAVCDIIARERIPLVGISAVSPQMHNTMRFARAIRARFGDAVSIALGGYHVSNDPTFLDRHHEIDFSVVGDGDITFPKLAAQVLGGEKVKGRFVGELVGKLDDVPWPAYDLTPLPRYRQIGLTRYPTLATRGCPFSCVFCSRSFMSKRVRYRSPENLVAELAAHYDDFGGHYEFMDESFTLSRRRVIANCQAILGWGKKIRWSAGSLRLDQVDEEVLEYMTRAGCRTFFVGIESGDERVRRKIVGKKLTDAQIFDAFKVLDKFDLEVEGSFVLGHPTETEEELRATCYFPVRLKRHGARTLTQIGLKPAVPMPGSRLWDIAIEEGKIPADFMDRYIEFEYGEDFWKVWPTYVPDGLTHERIRHWRKKGYLAYYLRPGYLWWRLKRNLASPALLLDDLRNFWAMLVKGHSTVSLTE
jgi:radical SAM superfamily enzyme YgiQ (UPF0313 family)